MNIQEALKETGKAVRTKHADNYAAIKSFSLAVRSPLGGDRLYWYDVETDEENSPVQLDPILSDDWQPHPEVKEIRPENAGELWIWNDIEHTTIARSVHADAILFLRSKFDIIRHIEDDIVHGKNGWARLFPLPEDNSIERIEIEAELTSYVANCGGSVYSFILPDGYAGRVDDKTVMLEIPKEV